MCSNCNYIKFIFTMIVSSTIFLYPMDRSIATMNLKQLLPLDDHVFGVEKHIRSKLSKLICSDCHDSNLQLTADEITTQKDKSPSLFNVFINMAVHKSNPNNSEVVPISHQGPRRVLLERIDEQTKQINDCNKMVKDFSDLTSNLKKSNDECEIESYINIVKREELCSKQMEEIRAKCSKDMINCNSAIENLAFWMNESKTCSKSSQHVEMELEQCKVNISQLTDTYDAFKSEVDRKANTTDSILSNCKSQEVACLSNIKNLSTAISLIGQNYATCNASLSHTEAKILVTNQQNTELNDQLSGLQKVVQDKNNDLVAITTRSFDLEKALSMLQEELEHIGDGSEMDKMTSISRSSLFLYSMLLLLLGYFIREFKVVFRETSEKKVVSVDGESGVVEGHVIPADSIAVKTETDDASCSLNSSGSAFIELDFPAADSFDNSAELSKENILLKEKLEQLSQEKVFVIKLNQQLRRLVGSTSDDDDLADMEDNVHQLTHHWGKYASLQEKEAAFEGMQERLAERNAEMEAAVGRCQEQIVQQSSLLLQVEKELKDLQEMNSSQLSELNQRDEHINALQQNLDSAETRTRSLVVELDAAVARVNDLENELSAQIELAESTRNEIKLTLEQQIQELYIQLDNANAEIETLKSTAVEVLNRTVSDLRAELDEMSSSRDDADQRCALLSQQLLEVSSNVSSLEAEIENLRDTSSKDILATDRTVQNLKSNLDEVSVSRDDADQRCERLTQQLSEASSRISSLEAEVENLRDTNAKDMSAKNRTVQDLEAKLEEVSLSRDDADQRLASLTLQLSEASSKISSLEAEVENLRDASAKNISAIDSTVQNLKSKLDEVSLSRDDADQRCELLTQQQSEASSRISSLEAEVENLRDTNAKDLAAMDRTVQNLKSTLDEVSLSREDADKRCELLTQQLAEALSRASDLEVEIGNLREERAKDSVVIEALNQTVKDLKVDLDQVFASKDGAEKRLAQQLNEALSNVSKYEAEITNLRDEKAKDSSAIEELNGTVKDLKVDLDKVFMSKDDAEKLLKRQLSEAESKVSNQEVEIDKLRDEKAKDLSAIGNLDRTVQHLKADFDKATMGKDDADQRCALLDQQLAEALSKVSSHESAIESICGERADDSALIEALKRQVETLTADAGQVSLDRDDAEKRCALLTQQLSEASSNAILHEELFSQQLNESRAALATVTAESYSVKQQLTSEIENVTSALIKSDEELRLSKEQAVALEDKLDNIEKELLRLRECMSTEKLENDNAQKKLLTDFAAKEALLMQCQQKLDEALAIVDEQARLLSERDEDLRRVQSDLETTAAKVATLQREMATSTKNFEAVILDLQQKVASAEATIKDLDKAKASLTQSLLERERTLSFLQLEYQTCRVNITEVCENALNLNARSEALVKVLRDSFEEHRDYLKIHDEEKGPRLSFSDSDTGDEVFSANNPMFVVSTDSQESRDSLSASDDTLRHATADVPNQVMLALEKIRSIPNQLTSIEFHTTLLQRFLDSNVAAQKEQAASNADEVSDLKRQIEEAALFIKQENSILTEMLRYRGTLATRDSGITLAMNAED